jgi:hypothetical protein
VAAQYLYQLISVEAETDRVVNWVGLYRPLYILDDAGVVIVICLQLMAKKWAKQRERERRRARRRVRAAAASVGGGLHTSTGDLAKREKLWALQAELKEPDNILDNLLSKLYEGNTLEVTYLVILIAAFLRYDLSATIDVGILVSVSFGVGSRILCSAPSPVSSLLTLQSSGRSLSVVCVCGVACRACACC